MVQEKTTRQVTGWLGGVAVEGYEIHVGQTEVAGEPLLFLDEDGTRRPEGVRRGRVMGTYLHGLFDAPGVVAALLSPVRPDIDWPILESHRQWRQAQLDRLGEHLRGCLDLDRLSELTGFPTR